MGREALAPALAFVARPSKGIRRALVPIGIELAGTRDRVDPGSIEAVQQAIEWIHAGSLVVDDIQDNAPERRGRPTLHRTHGIASALGGGLWLTFAGLDAVSDTGVDPETELALHRLFGHALHRAARGQAIDVGTDARAIPQGEVAALCRDTIADKTGALVSLPLMVGARLAHASPQRLAAVGEFGERLGCVLQMFNDLGDVRGDFERGRPSWVFATAATLLDAPTYARFSGWDTPWPRVAQILETHHIIGRARCLAIEELSHAREELRAAMHHTWRTRSTWRAIDSLTTTIAAAY